MSDQTKSPGTKFSTDWLLRGVLTKIGDTFDRLTGRSYRPSSSLATSELVEKLKKLLDHELRDGRFVPHNIKLKMQWDKFSTDSDEAIKTLENELTVAVIDHINDRRYHTYAPISLVVKPDYFIDGVKLLVSFDKFDKEDHEVGVNVTVPQIKVADLIPSEFAAPEPVGDRFFVRFTAAGKARETELEFKPGQRLSVGRGSENDLTIDDPSVSKIHASLVVNAEARLAVADTGSTNGTFVNGSRIAYGKAIPVEDDAVLKFGTVEVAFERIGGPVFETPADEPTEQFVSSFEPPTVAHQPESEDEPATRIAVIKKIEAPASATADEAKSTIQVAPLPRPSIDLPPIRPAAPVPPASPDLPDDAQPTIPGAAVPRSSIDLPPIRPASPVAPPAKPAVPPPAASNPASDAPEPTADRIVLNFDSED